MPLIFILVIGLFYLLDSVPNLVLVSIPSGISIFSLTVLSLLLFICACRLKKVIIHF